MSQIIITVHSFKIHKMHVHAYATTLCGTYQNGKKHTHMYVSIISRPGLCPASLLSPVEFSYTTDLYMWSITYYPPLPIILNAITFSREFLPSESSWHCYLFPLSCYRVWLLGSDEYIVRLFYISGLCNKN